MKVSKKIADKITGEYNGKKFIIGPRGGKYYINAKW
jgi:colicin import membrane protein